MKITERPLWIVTKDLHHACEQHQVGSAMASGTPPIDWYAKWLKALWQIHNLIDSHQHPSLGRVERLEDDLKSIGVEVKTLNAAEDYCNEIFMNERRIAGACYVLTGAHLMGGEIMRRRLIGYPTKHLEWEDRKKSLDELSILRQRDDIAQEARNCFLTLLKVMDEIVQS
jgi:hypothetical protein